MYQRKFTSIGTKLTGNLLFNQRKLSISDKLLTFNNFLISADKMDEPIQFALNQPFPFPELIPPIDGTRTNPGLGFSALMVCVENPRLIEIEIFTSNPIRYGVYASENIRIFS